MEHERYLIGIDNGGSNIKCAVFDTRGNELAAADVRPETVQPAPGMVERDPEKLWRLNCRVVADAIARAGIRPEDVLAVSLCGYGGGVCLVGKNGEDAYPAVVSTDSRALPQVKRMAESGAAQDIFAITHQQPWAGQPAALLGWFRENAPDVLGRSQYALTIKDYVRYRLTGHIATEATDASNLNLINPATRTFDEKLFELARLTGERRLFDYPLLASEAIAGHVTDRAAAATGLRAGTPVAAGLYDVAASSLGCGALEPGMLCVTNGTWTMASYLGDSFAGADAGTIATVSCIGGKLLLEQGSATGTGNFNWFLDNFLSKMHPEWTKRQMYDECDAIIRATDPRDATLLFVPYLYASSTHPDAKGAFLNLSGRHGADAMCYAVMEGILLAALRHVDLLRQGAQPFGEVRLAGGVSASEEWSRMFCDMLQMPVKAMAGSQQGACGAAICAGLAAGVFADFGQAAEAMCHPETTYEPRLDRAAAYAKKNAQYGKALRSLELFYEG